MIYTPHPYQDRALNHIIDNPFSALFMDMGLGKTVVTLTAVRLFLFDCLEIGKVLVIAPKRVAEVTWPEEVRKWNHTKGLKLSIVAGTEKERQLALFRKADIYVIGVDNVNWLVTLYGQRWPFKTVVIDELSKFKNPSSKRFKNLKKVRPLMKRVVGLTGTPAPKSLLDLWPQVYLLDRGERLGQTMGSYKEMFFNPGQRNGYAVYNWNLIEGCEVQIYGLIADLCISMKAEDYLDLPKRLDQVVEIELPAELRAAYRTLKREAVLDLGGEVITAANAAGVLNKLSQFCNGATYVVDENGVNQGQWQHIHDLKLEAVREDLEATGEEPFLLFYQFRHDRERLLKGLKEFGPRELKTAQDVADWNAGKIKLLIAHPASAGHGLNLQHGGHYCGWFGLTWDLELYLQAIHRLDRQGQRFPVVNRLYLVKGTVEFDMLATIQDKNATQNDLLYAVKAMVAEELVADLC